MKLFFLFCWLAFIAPAPYPAPPAASADHRPSVRIGTETYRTFQPSKIRKQKRKLRHRINGMGWAVMLAGLAGIAGTILLLVWLWPAAGLFWRIMLGWLGLSLIVGFLVVGLFGLVYGRQSSQEVRNKARTRLEKLAEKLPFQAAKTWCFPNEYYRISMAADSNTLLIVDYKQDKGWIIPKENIATIQSDTVSAQQAEALYPPGRDIASIVPKAFDFSDVSPRARWDAEMPMQVLQFQLRGLPLQQMTVVYSAGTAEEHGQAVKTTIEAFWKE